MNTKGYITNSCVHKNAMAAVTLLVRVHMSTHYALLCTQNASEVLLCRQLESVMYTRAQNGILCTQEYKAHYTVEVVEAFSTRFGYSHFTLTPVIYFYFSLVIDFSSEKYIVSTGHRYSWYQQRRYSEDTVGETPAHNPAS